MESAVNQTLALASSWAGLLLAGIGIIAALLSTVYRPLRWLSLAVCICAASFALGRTVPGQTPRPLMPLLQVLSFAGRPVTMLALCQLIVISVAAPQSRSQLPVIPSPIVALLVVQLVLLCKFFQVGLSSYGFFALLVYALSFLAFRVMVSSWFRDRRDFTWGIRSIALAGGLFCVLCMLQAAIDPSPLTSGHGRFQGLTGNSQHAAVLLGCTLPCVLFLASERHERTWVRIAWSVLLAIMLILLLWTRSRTGAAMVIVGGVVYYRRRLRRLFPIALACGAVVVIAIELWGDELKVEQIGRLDDTRSAVFGGMWRGFLNDPLFGAPIITDRIGFGENSWLAMACATGVFGLAALITFAILTGRMLGQVDRRTRNVSAEAERADVVLAGLSTLFIGSWFEAFLLPVLGYPLFCIHVYLCLAQCLLIPSISKGGSPRRMGEEFDSGRD